VYFGQTFKYPNFGDNSILAKLDHALSNILTTPLSLSHNHMHILGDKQTHSTKYISHHACIFFIQIFVPPKYYKDTPSNHHNAPSSTSTPLWSDLTIAAAPLHLSLVLGRRSLQDFYFNTKILLQQPLSLPL
jgi:hypothetical protein